MYLGIDIGSISINAVLLNNNHQILDYVIDNSGYNHKESIEKVIAELCSRTGITKGCIKKVTATGYGRRNVLNADYVVTEITCHAVGINSIFPKANLMIDVGGQDTKVIKITQNGYVETFLMNDKCSAGTGRFLEVMAGIMDMDISQFSLSGLVSQKPYKISSTCTVFAESEVISAIAKGVKKEDIIAGVYQSIVDRLMSMVYEIGLEGEIILTGGVAKNRGVAEYMRKRIQDLKIPPEPQITGALGAAIIAGKNDE